MKSLRITHFFKAFALIAMLSLTASTVSAQVHTVFVKMNYKPLIVPNAPTTAPNVYDVCENVPMNLKTLYVATVDTNSVPLADADYTLVFSEASDFSTPIVAPDYSYILTGNATKTIYAKVTMNNALACTNDTFSFVLNPKPEPVFTTQMLTTCYGVNVNLTNAIVAGVTDAGTSPLVQFSTDSAGFTSITDSANYNATVLGGVNGGDYKLFARLQNTESGCYSLIMPFILHIDTMPTLTLTAAATSGNTEVCDGTTINLESFVTSTTPATGTTLEFSVDTAFTTPLTGTAATAYVLTQNNTIQSNLIFYVRAKMSTTGCLSVGAAVQNFTLKVNPMPTLVLTATANGDSVCDATTLNLESYVSSYTSGSTLQFSVDAAFTLPLTGTAATAYALALGNTTTQDRQFYVRAVLPAPTNCVTVIDSVKTFTIKINPAPTLQTITSTMPANGCSNNIIGYSVPSQASVTYLWSATGVAVQGSGIGANDSIRWGLVNPTAVAQVVYTLTTGTKACSRTATLDVNVLQSPTDVNLAIVEGSSEFCDNGTQEIVLEVSVTDGTPNFVVDYSWSPDNGTGSVTTNGTPTQFTVTLPNKGVNYAYTINQVTDANGCKLIIPALIP